jgi:hypothetical protein
MSASVSDPSFDPDLDICCVSDSRTSKMSLLVIVFCLELALYFISNVGAKPINEAVRTPPPVQTSVRTNRSKSYGKYGAEHHWAPRAMCKNSSNCAAKSYA